MPAAGVPQLLAEPEQARAALRIAVVGVVKLISDLYPNEPSYAKPFNDLLYALADLDHGRVVTLFRAIKVSNRPGTTLAENLFRAIAAAAMTKLMEDGLQRRGAASHVARKLSKMGAVDAAGKAITAAQVAKWREKMTTERPAENHAVARYQLALQQVRAKCASEAVALLLSACRDLSPGNFPKKPPA